MNLRLILKNLINKIITVLLVSVLLFALSFSTACNAELSSVLGIMPGQIACPNYYNANSYLDNKIKKINQIAAENQIDDSFFFISDLHWECNTRISPILVNRIRSETPVKQVILGGDYYSHNYADVEMAKSMLLDSVGQFS